MFIFIFQLQAFSPKSEAYFCINCLESKRKQLINAKKTIAAPIDVPQSSGFIPDKTVASYFMSRIQVRLYASSLCRTTSEANYFLELGYIGEISLEIDVLN